MRRDVFMITRQNDRYGNLGIQFPKLIICIGTEKQAINLANYLSDYFPGCDYIYKIPNLDDYNNLEPIEPDFTEIEEKY